LKHYPSLSIRPWLSGRDGPKTQTGIETWIAVTPSSCAGVATDRKPRPGLKHGDGISEALGPFGRDGPKTQTGIETPWDARYTVTECRDGPKTQTGIETKNTVE